jgi:hypothetical protein
VNTVMPVIDANGLQAAAVYVDAGGAVTNFWDGSSGTFTSGSNYMGTTYSPA